MHVCVWGGGPPSQTAHGHYSVLTHPFDGFLLLRCNLDVVDRRALLPRGPHLAALPDGFVQHLDEPLLMLIDLLWGGNTTAL